LIPRQQPFFSIIVPTYNRFSQSAACMRSLAQLDYPRDRFEVIVVDDGSAPPLDSMISPFHAHASFTLLRQAHAGPAAARNTGAAQAQGDFLVFTADDCTPARDWLRTLATRFDAAPDCAIGGRILNSLDGNPYSTATDLLIQYLYSYYNADSRRAQFFTPNNLAVPAQRFRAMGGFDASFISGTGEDREFCDRWVHQGYPMIYAPEVVVNHSHALTFGTFWRLHFRYGCGTFRYRLNCARRRSGRIRLEPISFYINLLRFPVSRSGQSQRLAMAALLGLSQAANAAGYFWEKLHSERLRKEVSC
jgi:GT2 family glycosyltransferase